MAISRALTCQILECWWKIKKLWRVARNAWNHTGTSHSRWTRPSEPISWATAQLSSVWSSWLNLTNIVCKLMGPNYHVLGCIFLVGPQLQVCTTGLLLELWWLVPICLRCPCSFSHTPCSGVKTDRARLGPVHSISREIPFRLLFCCLHCGCLWTCIQIAHCITFLT